jgi:hypothetical protein
MQVPDILEDFPAFRTYQRQGLDLQLQYFHAEAMPAALQEQLFALCKENMEHAYNSAWGWDDKAKRVELTASGEYLAKSCISFIVSGLCVCVIV